MSPSKILIDLCAQHGLPVSLGQKLLPLVERGVNAPEAVRERILALVNRTIEREAKRHQVSVREQSIDDRMLASIAKVVHPWSPPGWLGVEADPDGPEG